MARECAFDERLPVVAEVTLILALVVSDMGDMILLPIIWVLSLS